MRKSLLVWGDSPMSSTGFGRVNRWILGALYDTGEYDITILAINHFQIHADKGPNYRIIPAKWPVPEDPYGCKAFIQLLTEGKWDAVFILNDLFVIEQVWQEIANVANRAPIIYYFPVDCRIYPSKSHFLEIADYPVAYTQWAKEEVLKVYPHLKNMPFIYHGVDSQTYKPLPAKQIEELRRDVYGEGKFVVLNVNRNNKRKNLPQTLSAFAALKKKYDECVLNIHTDPTDNGIDLISACDHLGLKIGRDVFFPTNYVTVHGFPDHIMNQIFNTSDVFFTTTLGEGFGMCVDPLTLISTKNGKVKEMQALQVGEEVLTHEGTYRPVLQQMSRKADVYQVKIHGVPPTIVTAEHPFLAIQDKGNLAKHRAEYENAIPQWVPLKAIKASDLVAIAKPQLRAELPLCIDLLDWIDKDKVEYDEKSIWYKMGYSPSAQGLSISNIQEKYKVSKRVAEDARRVCLGCSLPSRGLKGSKAYQVATTIQEETLQVNNTIVKVSRRIKVDERFLMFVGWYLAEGSNGGGSFVELDLHIREKPIAEFFAEYLKDIVGIHTITEKHGCFSSRLIACSSVFAEFMGAFCGIHAVNKTIPSELYNAAKYLGPMLGCLFLGDGNDSGRSFRLTTVSRTMAWQVRDILLANNIWSTIQSYSSSENHRPRWVVSVSGPAYEQFSAWAGLGDKTKSWTKRRMYHYIDHDNLFFVRVSNIQHLDQRLVLDIQVDQAHSFVGNGVILHNSAIEAMAAGVPVIVPSNTVHDELFGHGRGFRYPCKEMTYIDASGYRPIGRDEDVQSLLFKFKKMWDRKDPQIHLKKQLGRQWAEKYDWRAITPKWVKLFKMAINTPLARKQISGTVTTIEC